MKRLVLLAALLCASVAAAGDKLSLSIDYVTRDYPAIRPLSLLERAPDDPGVMGVRLADSENQLTGRLLGHEYTLTEHVIALENDFAAAAADLFAHGARLIVADLGAGDLEALAAAPGADGALILNMRAFDDRLRRKDCRANIYHIAPSWAMRADGLAQYLVRKRWTRWLMITGVAPSDAAYADALVHAAEKFGAEVLERRAYELKIGAKRVESGHQQIQTQMPLMTQDAPAHDVVLVVDTAEAFGLYLPYRTWSPAPVVGTHGLFSAAWARGFEQFGSMSLHSAFEKLAGRPITEADYLGWLAVKTFSEAALRTGSGGPDAIRAKFAEDGFVIPGFKGVGFSFRRWNHQLRQPMLIAWDRALVSMSPQEGFLHERHTLDSLGLDKPETACRLDEE